MNEKKKRYNWCASYTCSSMFSGLIDVPQSQTMFLEEDGKKRISISHLLEGN